MEFLNKKMFEFIAEIKTTKQTKKNLDNIYQVCFETPNPMVLDLGKLPPDQTVKVKVELDGSD